MISKVTCFPVKTAAGKVKANGVVTIEGGIDLKYILMQGPTDIFVSWAGGKPYTKKDGSKGWDSPIFIADKATNDAITKEIMTKYKSLSGGTRSANTNSDYQASNDDSFASDDIPF